MTAKSLPRQRRSADNLRLSQPHESTQGAAAFRLYPRLSGVDPSTKATLQRAEILKRLKQKITRLERTQDPGRGTLALRDCGRDLEAEVRHSEGPWERLLFLALPRALRSMTTCFEGTKQNHEVFVLLAHWVWVSIDEGLRRDHSTCYYDQ